MSQKQLIEKAGGNYSLCRIPGLVQTAQKTLLAYYECRKESGSDWDDIDLKIIRSTNGGESWSTVCLIHSNGATMNNPVLIADGKTIHFLYCKNYRQIYHAVSHDDGEHFSEPRDISAAAEEIGCPYTVVAVGPGHGIVYNGRLIAPVWYAYDPNDVKRHHPSFISTIYSDDGGQSWHMGEIIDRELLDDPSECALAITGEGDLMISIRNQCPEKQRALAYSKTGIDGWTTPKLEPNLTDPICQGSMDHANGTVYHVNCEHTQYRENLTVKISSDRFQSYRSFLVDDQGGYADIAVDDDFIYVFYERILCREGRDIDYDGLYFNKFPRV